ncbi:murein biosynthesis integral membrane protein MurJ [Gemmatimonas phototrophica]|uniref:murein biosynthesis integral membrane protein MurJ n=1 Tax=Gemmatimonas phototrophica TaxID=1379270 RepID=UPI0006A6C8C6|nr:murein biosynthesis integral membrane protein MurJ [Gemmatimonas phototrophica]
MSEAGGGRSAFVVGAGILISRVVGLLRNTAFAYFFGAGAASDAYNAAFKIPNAVRNLLGEGTLSAAFVPVYSRLLGQGDAAAARALANAVLGLLLVAVSLLTLVGIAGAPVLTAVLAPGFDHETQQLATRLTRVLFPMTGVMVLSGWCLGIQNSHRRFFWSYASAALWSVAQIVLLLVWGPRAHDAQQLSLWLAWATLAGALLQVAGQMPEVLRLTGPLRPTLNRAAEGVGQTLRNIVPVVTALGVVQISGFVDLQIASYLPAGAATNITYANTLALLPVSLFGVSVAAASLPEFSRDSGAMALDALRERLRGGWQRILFYVVPSTIVFIVLGDYCVGVLYRAGQFGEAEQRVVHAVLAGYAVGLVSFGSVKLLGSAFYALQDYRTPLRASVASITVSAAAAVAIAVPLRASPYATAGIALASAMGSYVNLAVLARGLRRRLGTLYTPSMWMGTRRILVAALCAAVVGGGARVLHTAFAPTLHVRLAAFPIFAAFAVAYLGSAWWMGSAEAARWLRRAPRASRHG